MSSPAIRDRLVEGLWLDLVGPARGVGDPREVLPQTPSRWYITGFLIPVDAPEDQASDPSAEDTLDGNSDGGDEDDNPAEQAAARKSRLPGSAGLSTLIPKELTILAATIRYGDYIRDEMELDESPKLPPAADAAAPGAAAGRADSSPPPGNWKRIPREYSATVDLAQAVGRVELPESRGVWLEWSVRSVPDMPGEDRLPLGTRSLSVFVVNNRPPAPTAIADEAAIFQVELELAAETGFVPRPDLKSLEADDWDDRLADLQYRDVFEFAVGHCCSAEGVVEAEECRLVRTTWLPVADVERVAPSVLPDVLLGMEALGTVATADEAIAGLAPLAAAYGVWLEQQRQVLPSLSPRRQEMATELLHRAALVKKRIETGIDLLRDPVCFEAFQIANRAMAAQARRRLARSGKTALPEWRPFQLAFVLMTMPGIADPTDTHREFVDLLFFPTGGGKTEAYLGLAAFTLVLRRLRDPEIGSAGLSVLMRYTLRLLTLDQLGRAAALICALELERQRDVEKLGKWPFEIGLWVGRAATPNKMGRKGDKDEETARLRTINHRKDSKRHSSPVPLEECPWCGHRFGPYSFSLSPNDNEPTDLRIRCLNRDCDFSRDNDLPILTVDEPIYRRLPCFLIATVDKFAGLPWVGETGAFFGRVDRFEPKQGFFGPMEPGRGGPIPAGRLPPPDLIIQDELHLISGPLGTMAGLYETALEGLAETEIGGKKVHPKIVASTATVRRAERQIRALFNHRMVEVFPPPGPDRRDSFFARTLTPVESPARRYVGVAAQGRSPKSILLRVDLALLTAAQKAWNDAGGKAVSDNPADPYMTLLGYFNSLRELGGARRLIEDDVFTLAAKRGERRRVGEAHGLFHDRMIAYEPIELTSRISTAKVAEAKRALERGHAEEDHVDIAIATNMISVGLDITRLGLMVVFGQPKTSAEYIQATSRVGRNEQRPGLVVTVFNVHRPRDRSHYERFATYHATFYRSVEATSVTPFSPRALDRGLAGTLVALARHGVSEYTPPRGAGHILKNYPALEAAVEALSRRAEETHRDAPSEVKARLAQAVRDRCRNLLDEWSRIAKELADVGRTLVYQPYERDVGQPLLRPFLDPELERLQARHRKFRANRSLRDVEPNVNLFLKPLDNLPVEPSGGPS
jgi:hypothetical protein